MKGLTPIALSSANIADAVELARGCFDKQRDRDQLSLDFHAFARGKVNHADVVFRTRASVLGYFGFYDGRVLVGTGGSYILIDRPATLWLSWIAVRQGRRGSGLGKEIVSLLSAQGFEKGCMSVGCTTADAESNAAVHHFYEAQGFIKTGLVTCREEQLRIYERAMDGTAQRAA